MGGGYLYQIRYLLSLMGDIIHPCSLIGKLRDDISTETGAKDARVFAVGSHDTASRIAAIDAEGDDWAFLSPGTWSLLGMVADEPILNEEAMSNNFTNEGAVDNKILFMRNITDLWLLQRLVAEWENQDNAKCTYSMLLSECEKAKPFGSIVDSDDSVFTHLQSMTKAIGEYCHNTIRIFPNHAEN